MMSATLPASTRAVVIGGGVVGCSIAYHLARLGWQDVVLLERGQLTCGTTWHAAGLVGQLRGSLNMTRLAKYTAELYAGLERETGQATGFRQHGSISLATTPGRLSELRRNASMAKVFDLRVDVIDAREVAARYPLIETADVLGAVFIPSDGQVNPVDVTMALAKGARQAGALIVEHAPVSRVLHDGRKVTGVELADGRRIAAARVVIAAGMWTRELAAGVGVRVPLHACEHFYVVTAPSPAVPRDLPVLRDYDACAYYKEDARKILLGCFEPVARPWGMNGIPADFSFGELPVDHAHLEPILEAATRRMPLLGSLGIQTFFCGPESFTPDARYHLGEAPGLDGCFVAAGLNSIGIQSAGGIGRVLAEWLRDGHPPLELWEVDLGRNQPFQANRRYLRERVTESLGLLYAMHWPHRQYETARAVRRSPVHEHLARAGACFGQACGWERANWFAPAGVEPRYVYTWQRPDWLAHSAAEHRAAREGVALCDLSSLAAIRVQGRDAVRVLGQLCTKDLAVADGGVVRSLWLNGRGTIEADVLVLRLASDEFLIWTSAETEARDLAWLRRHLPAESHCWFTSATSGLATFALAGPRARELLALLTPADVGARALAPRTSHEIEIGHAFVRVARVSYTGELGYELHVATEFAAHVYEHILAAGRDCGLAHAGFHALDSLRIEKAYPHWGSDVTTEDSPLEAGLMSAVDLAKAGGFLGRDALLARQAAGTHRRLVQLLLAEPEPMLHRSEPILRDGAIVGAVSSGAYGHTLGAAVGLGYVYGPRDFDQAWLDGARFEVEIEGRPVPARASLAPLYDPLHTRVRG